MKRVFVAIKVDPTIRFKEVFSAIRSGLTGERIKWVEPDNIHITLAFLGDLLPGQISRSMDITKKIAAKSTSFILSIYGTGLFRNMRDPRVIWFGLIKTAPLESMAGELCSSLSEEGLYKNDRPFRAHITLGRIKGRIEERDRLAELIEKYGKYSICELEVKEIIYYESILRPKGPHYIPLGRFTLR